MEKKRILLVDDEIDLLNMMRGVLATWGYDIITSSSGREAIRIARSGVEFLDIIILDIVMPDLDGIETLRRIRRFNKNIPVLMLTGYPSEERLKKSKRLGIAGFISKGPQFIDSARIIRTALKNAKAITKIPKRKVRSR